MKVIYTKKSKVIDTDKPSVVLLDGVEYVIIEQLDDDITITNKNR